LDAQAKLTEISAVILFITDCNCNCIFNLLYKIELTRTDLMINITDRNCASINTKTQLEKLRSAFGKISDLVL
jgi:hypothetical protein